MQIRDTFKSEFPSFVYFIVVSLSDHAARQSGSLHRRNDIVSNLLNTQQLCKASVTDLIDGLIGIVHTGFFHCLLLFVRYSRVRINAEHEGIKYINKVLLIVSTHLRTELVENTAHIAHGLPVGGLKTRQ